MTALVFLTASTRAVFRASRAVYWADWRDWEVYPPARGRERGGPVVDRHLAPLADVAVSLACPSRCREASPSHSHGPASETLPRPPGVSECCRPQPPGATVAWVELPSRIQQAVLAVQHVCPAVTGWLFTSTRHLWRESFVTPGFVADPPANTAQRRSLACLDTVDTSRTTVHPPARERATHTPSPRLANRQPTVAASTAPLNAWDWCRKNRNTDTGHSRQSPAF